jgi:hypothetical protein
MFIVTLWLILSIAGLILAFFGAFVGAFFDGLIGIGFVAIGGVIMFFPTMQVGGTVKRKRLVPFFMNLKKGEQISLFVNSRFQVMPFIFNTKHEGILIKRRVGMVEDKGTQLTWGDSPISISLQGLGVTLDLKRAAYIEKLHKNRGIDEYEQALQAYLGPARYTEFYNKFRRNPKPDIYAIRKEIDYILSTQTPNDPLAEEVLGETINFKHFARWMVYAYHPQSSQNAMDAEKIQVKKEMLAYKEADRAASWGKAIVMIIIAIMIFLIVMGATGGLSFLGF